MNRRVYDIEVTSKRPTPEPDGPMEWLPGAIVLFCVLLLLILGLG